MSTSENYKDYHTFGAPLPSRTYYSDTTNKYTYGYNSQEKIDEVFGSGNYLDFKFRGYDPRLGRFFTVDPLTKKYPELTPYQFAGNKPVWARELEGLEAWYSNKGSLPNTNLPLTEVKAEVIDNGPYSIEYAASNGLSPEPSFALSEMDVTPNGNHSGVTDPYAYDNAYEPIRFTAEDVGNALTTTEGILKTAGVVATFTLGPEAGVPLYEAGEVAGKASSGIKITNDLLKGNYKDAAIEGAAAGVSSLLNNRSSVLKDIGADEVQKLAADALGEKVVDMTKDNIIEIENKGETTSEPK